MKHKKISRRVFLGKTGALLFGFMLPVGGNAQNDQLEKDSDFSERKNRKKQYLNAFIKIKANNEITFFIPDIEIGQGILTAASMILAEELDVDLKSVSIETKMIENEQIKNMKPNEDLNLTYGSCSVAKDWFPLRQGAAELRMMLLQTAAAELNIDKGRCHTENGYVICPDNQTFSYGMLISKIMTLDIPESVQFKNRLDYKIIGKPQPRIDTDKKIKGQSVYGMDIKLSGMKTGYIISSPIEGDQIHQIDDRQAKNVPGIQDILKNEKSICIIADNFWHALKAAECLVVKWQGDENIQLNTSMIYENLKKGISKPSTMLFHNKNASVSVEMENEKKLFQWDFFQPMLLHAALEPINCTIYFHDNQCELWIGSQAPSMLKGHIAEKFHLCKENVILHYNEIGGSFGRRLDQKYILDAAEFARQVSYPVNFIWSREADFQNDALRPPYYDQLKIGVNNKLAITSVHHKMMTFIDDTDKRNPSSPNYLLGLDTMPYHIHDYKFEYSVCDAPKLNFGSGQGREATRNVFVLENMINNLALYTRMDPIEYRKTLGLDDRAKAVVDLLLQNVEWNKSQSGDIRQGFAMAHVFGSYIALIIEAEITTSSVILIHRADVAVDCGLIVNPEQVCAQIEGSVVFGLSDALYGEVQIENGQIKQRNYNQYRVLRMNDMPNVKVHMVNSNESPSGIGELGTIVAAPALGHALGLIQGKFFHSLPLAKQVFQHK